MALMLYRYVPHSMLQEVGFPESGRSEICHSFRDFLPPITLAHYGHMKNPTLLFIVFAK
jgi:hypothetical protein